MSLSFDAISEAPLSSGAVLIFNLSVSETLSAVDSPDGAVGDQNSSHDTLSPADTVSSSFAANPSVSDILSAADTGNGIIVFTVAVTETLSAVDTATERFPTRLVADTLSPIDSNGVSIGPPGIWNLSAHDTLNAVDTPTDPETFTSPGLYFWGYHWAYGVYDTLAVFVGGIDLGNHPINPNGSIFVPWQSDTDGLFTPAYLMLVSNNPPELGFGGTACNIDVTDNNGDTHRLIVGAAIGVPYKSQVQLLRPNTVDATHSPYGPSLAETRRLHQYGAQFVNTSGVSVGTTADNLRPAAFRHPNGSKYLISDLFTGVHWDVVDNDYDFNGQLMVQVERPWPMVIAALSGFMKTFDRS